MADNKSKPGGGDRKRVAASQGYEVSYFARKHGLSSSQAREIIERVGNDRKKLNAEAHKMATKSARGRGGNRGSVSQAKTARDRTRDRRVVNGAKDNSLGIAAAVGGAVAAGVLLWLRRNRIGDQIGQLASDKSPLRQKTEARGEFAAEGTTGGAFKVSPAGSDARTQAEIAEEALTLKETGQTPTNDRLKARY